MSSSDTGCDAVAAPARRGPAHAIVMTMRPHQWIKNLLVFAAPSAAGVLGADDVLGRTLLAVVAFCMLASGVYAINDVRDVAEDRRHPRKRYRPVAAGELSPRLALVLAAVLLTGGLALCAMVNGLLALTGSAYVVLTLSYTLVWRYVVLLDVLAIAGGFVLRAVAGGVAAPVALSRWFVLVITCAAIFVAAGKRLAELQRSLATRGARRRVLERYTQRRLRLLLAGSAGGALFAYCIWAFAMPLLDGVPWRLLTIPPFAVCLLRYQRLARTGEGEAPEEVLATDVVLQLAAVTWLVLFSLCSYASA
jgi:decaprenyl-phosphate phosphoribosyltransferase